MSYGKFFKSVNAVSVQKEGPSGQRYIFAREGVPTKVDNPMDVKKFIGDSMLETCDEQGRPLRNRVPTGKTPMSKMTVSDVVTKEERELVAARSEKTESRSPSPLQDEDEEPARKPRTTKKKAR